MRVKNNILILDTETTGDFAQPFVHDLGYCIIDKDFNILTQKRFLTKQARACKWALNYSEFYRSKASLYDSEIENGTVEIKAWNDIVKELYNDIKTYKVGCLSAYNLAFDFRALNFTEHFLNNDSNFIADLFDKKRLLCIWNLACETILQDKEYKEFCKSNGYITQAGNYLTNAETTYKYITNKLNFKEDHTALSDVLIEKEILEHIIKQEKGKVEYGLAYNCWKKVTEK